MGGETAAKLSGPVIALDPEGALTPNSEEFADLLFNRWFAEEQRISFLVGGASGFPEELRARLKSRADCNYIALSLGPLTFPHRVARVLLLEQIFRAREIIAERGYHDIREK